MTKKDYIAIAEAIRVADDSCDMDNASHTGVYIAATSITKVMAADNPRFDRDKFLKACGF